MIHDLLISLAEYVQRPGLVEVSQDDSDVFLLELRESGLHLRSEALRLFYQEPVCIQVSQESIVSLKEEVRGIV